MNATFLFTALGMLIIGTLSVATASIAIECFNKNKPFKDTKESNFKFIIGTLVSGIVAILSAMFGMYKSFK